MISRQSLRTNLRANIPFILLCLLFLVSFTIPDKKAVTNFFRIIVCLPVLFIIFQSDVKDFLKNRFFALFVVVSVYTGLTLLWSSGDSELNIIGRLVATLLLVYMIYLLHVYDSTRFVWLPSLYVIAGAFSSFFVIINWEGLSALDYWGASYGILNHHVPLSWFFATCFLIAMYSLLDGKNRYLHSGLALIFLLVIIGSQSRGGFVFLVTGLIALLYSKPKKINLNILLSGIGLFSLILLLTYLGGGGEFWLSLIERGSSGRFDIYHNALVEIFSDVKTFILGRGAAADLDSYVGTFKVANYHNFYLNTWFLSGLVGLLLTLGLIAIWGKLVYDNRKIVVWDPVIIGMLAAFLSDGVRFYGYPQAVMFTFLMPLVLSVLTHSENRKLAIEG